MKGVLLCSFIKYRQPNFELSVVALQAQESLGMELRVGKEKE